VAVSTTLRVLSSGSVTYTWVPWGLTATASGKVPRVIVLVTAWVAVSKT
jgi:hypothetical protein